MQRTAATFLCLFGCWGWVATYGEVASGLADPPITTATSPASAGPLFAGIGSHHRPVSTQSPAAQNYFDQGLTWLFAFNHDEAIRSFEEAARLDPQLAIAWWGIAVSYGPHINLPLETE